MRKSLSMPRKIYFLIYNILGKYLPRTYMPYSLCSKRIRSFLAQNFIDQCGSNLKIETNVLLSPFIELGDNVELNENCKIRGNVKIGNDVLIAPGVQLISVNHKFDRMDIPIKQQGEVEGYIVIEDNVWIGTNAIILPNVTIKKGSIVGAGSIVTKNVEECSIVGGNPAKLIGKRSNNETGNDTQ